MKILFVTDTHGSIDIDKIESMLNGIKPEAIVCLGDMSYLDYAHLQFADFAKNIPIGCILGNHDSWNDIKMANKRECHLVDLNKQKGHLGEVTFVALSGALKYKDSDVYCFLSHRESAEIMSNAPSADILLSHDTAYLGDIVRGKEFQDPHEGLVGLADYIRKYNPSLHIHGHLHTFYDKIIETGCREICLYGYALLDIYKKNEKVVCNILAHTDNP